MSAVPTQVRDELGVRRFDLGPGLASVSQGLGKAHAQRRMVDRRRSGHERINEGIDQQAIGIRSGHACADYTSRFIGAPCKLPGSHGNIGMCPCYVCHVMAVGWTGCLGIVAAISSAPQPQPSRTVAVLPLTVEGSLGAASHDKLEEGIALGLARGNFDVIPPSRLSQEVGASPPCKDPSCFVGHAATLDADYLVQATVLDEDNRNYAVVLNLIDGRTGRVAARSEERCDVCGLQELRTLVEDQGAAMRRKLEDLVNGPPVIFASSLPSGALVSIDGELVGRTPVRRELSEGEHTARLDLEGYIPQERAFLAVRGLEETLAFELQQAPKQRMRLRPWGWASLAVGVPMLAAGATFLVLDERAAPGDRCSGGNVDPTGNCKFRYNTLTPGLVLTLTGAVLTAAAVAIVVRTRKGRPSKQAARAARLFARVPGAGRP